MYSGNSTGEFKMKFGSLEHTLNRADYYRGLLTKTTDPVYWDDKNINDAIAALRPVVERGHRRYENAFAAAQAALLKSY